MTPPEINDIEAITDLVKGGKDIKQIMAVLQALDAINENDKRKKLIEEEGRPEVLFLSIPSHFCCVDFTNTSVISCNYINAYLT